jgi:Ca-activated chloride channel homolog
MTHRKLLTLGLGIVALGLAIALAACESPKAEVPMDAAHLRNGFLDPSQVGRLSQSSATPSPDFTGATKNEEIWVVPTGPEGGGAVRGRGGAGTALGLSGSPGQTGQPLISLDGTRALGGLDISGVSTYTGGTVISGGSATFSGNIVANSGTITKTGTGTLALAPAAVTPAPGAGPATQPAAATTPARPGELQQQVVAAQQGMPLPGSPVLAARRSDGQLVPVPLKHTDVKATISGYIASVGVTQQFTNPYSEKIEAVYVFPLPENAGINEFVMVIGDRHIRGIIRERAEAEKIYQEAKAQGYTASLMNQERPNIFTQNVANIEPGKQIDIQIRYFHTLAYTDGWFEWVFPMVVGPRYNPQGSTDGVGAVGAGQAGISGQKTEVQYLRPEQRNGHDIALQVQLDAGVTVEKLESVNHQIRQLDGKNNEMLVQLNPADTLPNKDFVLRYKIAGEKTKTGLFVQKDKDGKGGWFTLMIVPPAELKSLPRRGVEMVFVMDTSGSMSGWPITASKAAVDTALQMMDPSDTFQVVKFASAASQMSPAPMPINESTIAGARQYVANLQGDGGTEMLKGINAALDFPHDENRTRVVAFLTDGYIGNETQILRALSAKLQDSRVFSFGVGSSVNRYLLDSMARLGHGNAAYLSLNEPAEPVMKNYFERISHPALANVKVSFGNMKVSDIYPQRIPELFVGRPIILTGKFTGPANGDVTVTGTAGSEKLTYTLSTGGALEENPAIGTVWARMKVADLHDEAIYEGRDVAADVKSTALEYGIMSEFTSFVAVDSTRITEGAQGTTVAVPVPVPEGVRYDTTVQTTNVPRPN